MEFLQEHYLDGSADTITAYKVKLNVKEGRPPKFFKDHSVYFSCWE